MATAAAADERDVSIGRVFRRALAAIVANPLAIFAIAFLFGALPSSVLGYGLATYGMRFAANDLVATIALGVGVSLSAVALTTIALGALVRLVIAHSEGGKASFGDSVGAGLAVAPSLLATAVLATLGILLGMVFLILPGLLLYLSWSVATSALVEERLGPVGALRRSSSLVEGARWKVAGLLLPMLAATWLASYALESAGVTGYTGFAGVSLDWSSPKALATLAAYSAFDTLTLAVWGTVQTSLYVELRIWKEGPATASLADIFG